MAEMCEEFPGVTDTDSVIGCPANRCREAVGTTEQLP